MSDITKLAKGELSPAEFATKVAAEINANPLEAACAQWVLDNLYALLARYLHSTTLAHVVVAAIKAAVEVHKEGVETQVPTITLGVASSIAAPASK